MESYLAFDLFNLVTPDGYISEILTRKEGLLEVIIDIEKISSAFVGFKIDPDYVQFNVKSTIAQLDTNATKKEIILNKPTQSARVHLELNSIGPIGARLLTHLDKGCFVGKLFAADPKRKVRDPDYLLRMFGRFDRDGLPLLLLGGKHGSKALSLEKYEGHLVAHLALKNGIVEYDEDIFPFLKTIGKALQDPKFKTRELLKFHQRWVEGAPRRLPKEGVLLVKTLPLHIRTAFGHVVEKLLPEGVHHTSASILQPDTQASGDIYELFGKMSQEITHIPLEFFTLEPHREHVFFSDRDQLQTSLEDPNAIFKTFDTAPKDRSVVCSVFIVKGEQMLNLKSKDWIQRKTPPNLEFGSQAHAIERYIEEQPSYPFLKAIESGLITSQGILFSRYFPSPLMKKMLLGDLVQNCLKGLYFERPSQSHGDYFSHEDRTLLLDLANFLIPVYWADRSCGKILQFAPKPEKDTGMFVPLAKVDEFIHATSIGVYGSNLISIQFEDALLELLKGLLEMRTMTNHLLLSKDKPFALITGGGPGVMETGNRVARKLGILSCANIVDFSGIEQEQNPYIDAKMTFRLDRLIERQGEFNLDFPIFLTGGFGTDFELALETVRRKVGIGEITPILLLGKPEYWGAKITSIYHTNLKSGTIAGSEWVSNCFYCVENAAQALEVYQKYFANLLPIGPDAPPASKGFHTVK